ncbi:hypothetical protein SAL_0439, partial [Streptococcus agalactiae 515]
ELSKNLDTSNWGADLEEDIPLNQRQPTIKKTM